MLRHKKKEEESDGRQVIAVHLRRKGIILGASFILLIALIVAGTTAWYTRIANVTGMTLKIAEFDVKANYMPDQFYINVNDYLNVQEDKAAPGTGGVIPILVESTNSEVTVHYTITLNLQSVAPEFLQRVRFYYYTNTKEGSKTVKKYLGGDRYVYTKNGETWDRTTQKDTNPNAIEGDLGPGDQKHYEFLYWEWVYELKENDAYDLATGTWGKFAKTKPAAPGAEPTEPVKPETEEPEALAAYEADKAAYDEAKAAYDEAKAAYDGAAKAFEDAREAHDDLDTMFGMGEYDATFVSDIDPDTFTTSEEAMTDSDGNPMTDSDGNPIMIKAYQKAMLVKLNVVGAQATPQEGKVANFAQSSEAKVGTAIYVADESKIK